MQSTLYEPVQPWGGTQKPPSHREEAGAMSSFPWQATPTSLPLWP